MTKLTIFLFLSFCLISSSYSLAYKSTHDDFVECLSHKIMNSTLISQVIHTPKNSSYSTLLNSFSFNLRISSNFEPSTIFTPTNESQIQEAIHCSKKHGLQIRIRGGGHDYEGLSYISEIPFVVIDLRNLRSISIDTEKKTAWIQAGATLGEVYYRIAEKSKKLAFAAGVCPTVGVGGHFSGGGYGMLSRKYGTAADNIIDAKLIGANGRIHDRESMGEDHFWAIRGGGGTSFGLIISWKIKLVDIPEKVTVFNVPRTLEQNVTQLVYKWQHIADKVDDNLLLRIFVRNSEFPFGGGQRTIHASFVALYVGGVDELLHEVQKSFAELGLVKDDCIEMSWIESTLFFAGFPRNTSLDVLLNWNTTTNQKGYFKGKSDYVQQTISLNGIEGVLKLLFNQLGGENSGAELQFSPYGGKLSDISEFEIPFPHRAGNIFMIEYAVYWGNINYSQSNIDWSRKIYRYMGKYVSKSPRAAYFNYRDLDLGMNNISGNTSYAQARIWGVKYFKNNFDRLVKIKTKIDPTNFFRNEQSIPPLYLFLGHNIW
ncbi:tetrahydroberberine oxidase-like [Solanum lycopersicum]|uniref:tetrahydroberberine oxidase-like n=1 Tax=Solanum lycopersicum TaxID=4081 RepID=UPI000276867A|nr:berberine bridge enzyme-like 28 [Solanum lycopersicum]